MGDLARDMVALPAPAWFPLLLLFVPGALILGALVGRLAFRGPATALAAAPGVALAMWLVLLQVGTLGSTSFYAVVAVATVLLGTAGYLLTPALGRTLPVAPRREWRPLGVAVGAVTVLMVPAVLTQELFDRDGFGGHYALVAQSLNDVIPPRDPTFTDAPFQYHMAVDYLVAAAVAMTRLPVDRVFDAVAILLWAYIALCAAVAARAAFGVRRPWIPAVAGALGGGIPWWIGVYDDLRGTYLDAGLPSSIAVYGPLPTVGQNVLQPPWLVGIPLALIVVTLVSRGRWDTPGPGRVGAAALLAVLMVGLAMSQTALFATVLAAVVLVCAVRLVRPAWRAARELVTAGRATERPPAPVVVMAGATLLGAVVATALGAGLVRATAGVDVLGPAAFTLADEGLTSQFGVKQLPAALRWSAFSMATTFVVLLALTAVVLRRRRRSLDTGARVLLVTALLGLVLVNVVRHVWSWDMLKFGAVAVVLLAVVAGAGVDDLWARDGRRARAVAATALVATIAGGSLYLAGFWRPVLRGDADWRPTTYTPAADPDMIRALSHVRERYTLGEVVVCEPSQVDVCGELAGLPQLYVGGGTAAVYSAKDRRRPDLLIRDQDQDFRNYLDANVRWAIVLREGSSWQTMLARAVRRRALGETTDFGPWRVVRFTPDRAFTRAPFPATGN